MDFYQGTSILGKIAIGKIRYYRKREETPYRQEIGDTEQEIARLEAAQDAVLAGLDDQIRDASGPGGGEEAAILAAHKILMKDPLYDGFIRDAIREQHVNAEYAVAQAQAHFVQMLRSVDDAFMRERAADVEDVSQRLLRQFGGGTEDPSGAGTDGKRGDEAGEPVIVAAEELMPSDILRLGRDEILAILVRNGAANSHLAILARTMKVPVIFGVEVREDWDGRTAVADGCSGTVILDPDAACLERMRKKQREVEFREEERDALRGKETVTRSGRRINLYANIGEADDVDAALAEDAEGIGLFRTEFLYLQAQTWPDEETQFATYRAVAEAMGGKKVVIRTLDAGLDKQIPCLELSERERGIRVCLERPELFRVQLRAILRAASYGTVAVMFPMIKSVEEVRACREQLKTAQAELEEAGKDFGGVEFGIMVETPEAVKKSAALAREVDFFCIGTNDLIPALFGVTRLDAGSCDPADPKVLAAIRATIANGHADGIWVGFCGEMAADTTWTQTLVEMGIDELSVAPGAVLKVREAVREIG